MDEQIKNLAGKVTPIRITQGYVDWWNETTAGYGWGEFPFEVGEIINCQFDDKMWHFFAYDEKRDFHLYFTLDLAATYEMYVEEQ